MESGTLAIVLALTLVTTGAMFLVIARQLHTRNGMGTFAAGLALFGMVFAVPPEADARAPLLLGVLIDTAAVAAVMMLRLGMQRFMQRPEPTRGTQLVLLAGFAIAAALARHLGGMVARTVMIELTVAVLLALLALDTARDAHRDGPLLRTPLRLLSGVLTLLALISAGEATQLALRGPSEIGDPSDSIYEVLLMLGALLLGPTLLWMHTARLARQLREFGTRDPLTRLLNENGLEEAVRRHLANRQHEPVTFMHIDVDHFAIVNTQHGEPAGDDVLRMVGLALESTVRGEDFVARVGGEEFVVASVGADLGMAAGLAERLRAAVADLKTGLQYEGAPVRCTVSIGLSRPFHDPDRWHTAWSEAELSLQAAKDAGCNCVVHPTAA